MLLAYPVRWFILPYPFFCLPTASTSYLFTSPRPSIRFSAEYSLRRRRICKGNWRPPSDRQWNSPRFSPIRGHSSAFLPSEILIANGTITRKESRDVCFDKVLVFLSYSNWSLAFSERLFSTFSMFRFKNFNNMFIFFHLPNSFYPSPDGTVVYSRWSAAVPNFFACT